MADKNNNPFDFSDLSDLPDDLAKKLHTDADENARVYADVIAKGNEAGLADLTINQVMAAAMRMGIDVPTQQTVRGYINRASELGLIHKPTRQTYAAGAAPDAAPKPTPKKGGKTKAEDIKTDDPVVTKEPSDDPLAALNL